MEKDVPSRKVNPKIIEKLFEKSIKIQKPNIPVKIPLKVVHVSHSVNVKPKTSMTEIETFQFNNPYSPKPLSFRQMQLSNVPVFIDLEKTKSEESQFENHDSFNNFSTMQSIAHSELNSPKHSIQSPSPPQIPSESNFASLPKLRRIASQVFFSRKSKDDN